MTPTQDEIEGLVARAKLDATVIRANYLTHPTADLLDKVATALTALRAERDAAEERLRIVWRERADFERKVDSLQSKLAAAVARAEKAEGDARTLRGFIATHGCTPSMMHSRAVRAERVLSELNARWSAGYGFNEDSDADVDLSARVDAALPADANGGE